MLYFLSFLILFTIVMVIFSYNPIHSVFWLVSTFLCSSIFLIYIGLDFIPLIIIIIYVGAITIIFLFVIMMLDIISIIEITPIKNVLPIILIIISNLFINFFYFFNYKFNNNNNYLELYWNFEYLNDISFISSILYTDYWYLIILISIILLISMIGVIVLTLSINNITKKQFIINQQQRFIINK